MAILKTHITDCNQGYLIPLASHLLLLGVVLYDLLCVAYDRDAQQGQLHSD